MTALTPSYDALLIISQSVAAALERAGVTECDDPGDAIDALAKDAARYRWLRDGAYYLIEPDRGLGPMIPCGDEMDIAVDAAIDAAMEGEK